MASIEFLGALAYNSQAAFGQRLRELRLAKGLTQNQLADLSGVSDSDISKLKGRSGCPNQNPWRNSGEYWARVWRDQGSYYIMAAALIRGSEPARDRPGSGIRSWEDHDMPNPAMEWKVHAGRARQAWAEKSLENVDKPLIFHCDQYKLPPPPIKLAA